MENNQQENNQPQKKKRVIDHFNDWLSSVNDIFRNQIKRPYYYVPPCPYCGSLVTGRFMKARNDYDADWMIDESLRHGEIISPVPNVLSENCFCCECNSTYTGIVEFKLFSADELDEQKFNRNINDIWQARNAEKAQKQETVTTKLINKFR